MKKIASDKNYRLLKEARKRRLVDHNQLQGILKKLKEDMRLEFQKLLAQQQK